MFLRTFQRTHHEGHSKYAVSDVGIIKSVTIDILIILILYKPALLAVDRNCKVVLFAA